MNNWILLKKKSKNKLRQKHVVQIRKFYWLSVNNPVPEIWSFLFEINSKFYNYTALYYKMGFKSLDVEGLGFKEY